MSFKETVHVQGVTSHPSHPLDPPLFTEFDCLNHRFLNHGSWSVVTVVTHPWAQTYPAWDSTELGVESDVYDCLVFDLKVNGTAMSDSFANSATSCGVY